MLTERQKPKIMLVCKMQVLRRLVGATRLDIKSIIIRCELSVVAMLKAAKASQLCWFGNIVKISDNGVERKYLEWADGQNADFSILELCNRRVSRSPEHRTSYSCRHYTKKSRGGPKRYEYKTSRG